jgi:hypothetical protein
MSNAFINQWVELSQASLNKFKELSDASIANLGTAKQPFSSADFAEVLKTSIAANKQLTEISTTTFMKLFHSQLSMLNLGNSTSAAQEVTEISSSLVGQFVQQQTQFVTEMTAAFSTYVTDLQRANGLTELTGIQTNLLNTLQQQLQNNAGANMELLNSAKVATQAWTEKTLDKASAQ